MKISFLNKTIQLIASTVIVSAFFSSCGKVEDDENILLRTFNRTVTNTTGGFLVDSLDINGDAYVDAAFIIYWSASSDSAICGLIGRDNSSSLVDSTQHFGSLLLSIPLGKNQIPVSLNPAKTEWSKRAFFASRLSGVTVGVAGAGEKYIPLAIENPITSKYNYGWVRISLSSDLKTLQIIDGAYNFIPDVPIGMGEK